MKDASFLTAVGDTTCPSKQENLLDATDVQHSTIVSSHLRQDFEALCLDIQSASKKSLDVSNNAEAFNRRGIWAQVCGTFNGRNDKDLACMIGSVSESLQITQRVIEILLKVQSEKNVVLKEFHRAVTEKIVDLHSNDNIIDLNLRDNLLTVFEHLQKQVEDKLLQADKIESHQNKIANIEGRLQQQDCLMQSQAAALHQQIQQVQSLDQSLHSAQLHLNTMHASLALVQTQLAQLPKTIRSNSFGKRDYLLLAVSLGVGILLMLQFFTI